MLYLWLNCSGRPQELPGELFMGADDDLPHIFILLYVPDCISYYTQWSSGDFFDQG